MGTELGEPPYLFILRSAKNSGGAGGGTFPDVLSKLGDWHSRPE